MDESKTITVYRKEVHYWPTCDCPVCKEERARRETLQPSSVKQLSVDAAYHLGLISRRSPLGSLARQLSHQYSSE